MVQLNNRVQIAPAGVYIGICIVLGLLMVGHTTNQLWSDLDFWVWLGPVREFAARPLNPTHPLVAVDAPDSYMGPYTFVLGGLTRLTGADPVNVMAIAGLANLGLLVAGLWHLTRRVSTATWAPPLALLFTLVACQEHPSTSPRRRHVSNHAALPPSDWLLGGTDRDWIRRESDRHDYHQTMGVAVDGSIPRVEHGRAMALLLRLWTGGRHGGLRRY